MAITTETYYLDMNPKVTTFVSYVPELLVSYTRNKLNQLLLDNKSVLYYTLWDSKDKIDGEFLNLDSYTEGFKPKFKKLPLDDEITQGNLIHEIEIFKVDYVFITDTTTLSPDEREYIFNQEHDFEVIICEPVRFQGDYLTSSLELDKELAEDIISNISSDIISSSKTISYLYSINDVIDSETLMHENKLCYPLNLQGA